MKFDTQSLNVELSYFLITPDTSSVTISMPRESFLESKKGDKRGKGRRERRKLKKRKEDYKMSQTLL